MLITLFTRSWPRVGKRSLLLFFFFSSLSLMLFGQQADKKPINSSLFYPGLDMGNFTVGYKTFTSYDYSRTYNLNYSKVHLSRQTDPRPIVINVWYPAQKAQPGRQMQYGDYIQWKNKAPELSRFLERLEAYNLKNSAEYMFYRDSLTAEQHTLCSAHLSQKIPVYQNADPLAGKFPLILYHAGLGGTLNDNSILCEYLASHGFVVVSGAFQSDDCRTVALDWDLERSTKDLDFMLNAIKDFPGIDFTNIGAIGHSFGAQAVLGYRTENSSPISWLIILDSTMDYAVDANPKGFELLTEKLYRKISNMNVPMLVFANPNATFKVIDSLTQAQRMYATISLSHNEFTSLTAFAVKKGLQQRNDIDTVWSKYILINRYCLAFSQYATTHDTAAKHFLFSKHPYIEAFYEIPEGLSLSQQTVDYEGGTDRPSAQQIQKLLLNKRKDLIEQVLNAYPDLLNEEMINDFGYKFIKRDIDFAVFLFEKNVAAHPDSWNAYDSLGEGYMIKGETELAIKNYRQSLLLNPKNENGEKMLNNLLR